MGELRSWPLGSMRWTGPRGVGYLFLCTLVSDRTRAIASWRSVLASIARSPIAPFLDLSCTRLPSVSATNISHQGQSIRAVGKALP